MPSTTANAPQTSSRPIAKLLSYIVEALCLIGVPASLALCAIFNIDQSALLTLVVALAALASFFVSFERSRPALRQIMPTVVLGALAAAGRILFAPLPDFKPVSAICIIAGSAFGRKSGFLVGAVAALASNFFFGQGAWTPWQMYAWGLVGYLAGCLERAGVLGRAPALLACGFLSAMLYGLILNGWFVVGFVHPVTWEGALAAYAAGFPLDCVHGIATVVFLRILYVPWRRKLKRIKRKYDLLVS